MQIVGAHLFGRDRRADMDVDPPPPADRQRLMGAAVVATGFGARKRPAVVAADDDSQTLGNPGLTRATEAAANPAFFSTHGQTR